ncbi:tetratricopeptide repeat protein [Fibrisoma montanum]|uniref:histidine kinase n=1 Tax=Fibrisoma montanum TaxID=2305895 RepID=A0A418M1I8_9BACT|nr:histidine kinase dimerization/phosphoacceptor domain -containing protein [Fibrisoma montanum]RIV19481.1 tetratricopeptide repeat protein [Fibrisoma montanum]
MKRLLISLFVLGLLLLEATSLIAQPKAHSIDSLNVLLKQSRPDTSRANLLLELARSYVLKPGELASDLDTSLLFVRQAYSLSRTLGYAKGQGTSYLIGGHAYREKGTVQKARQFDQMAINLFVKHHYPADLAAAYLEMGDTYGIASEELNIKISFYKAALPLFEQSRQWERLATTLKVLGDLNGIRHENAEALQQLKRALAIYKYIHYPDLQGVYDLMGDVSNKLGDFQNGLKYGLLALKTAVLRKDKTLQLCTIYNRLGMTYYKLRDYHSAQDSYEKALDIAKHYKDTLSVNYVGVNLLETFKLLGNTTSSLRLLKDLSTNYPAKGLEEKIRLTSYYLHYYQEIGNYVKAQTYCDQLIAQFSQLPSKVNSSFLVGCKYAIRFYLITNQLKQARQYISDYQTAAKQTKQRDQMAYGHLLAFQVDSAQGDFRSAVNHFKLYKAMQDSLLNERKNKEIANLQVAFETDKKDQEIQLKEKNIQLLQNKYLVQQASLKQREIQRNSMIGGAVLLSLLLGLTYNRYRIKQRNNQQLEAKQKLIDNKNQSLQQLLVEKNDLLSEKEQLLGEREWMLKEIHHRVKNNLQVISSMLNSQFKFLQDPSALTAIRESQNRVQVMALIHQKLYQSDNLAQINMKEYIHEIVDYLIESFDRFNTVRSQLDIADVYFDVALATPLGLIINEAVTNSLKYAFPNNQTGRLRVSLSCEEGPAYQLTIADDGIGLPAGFDVTRSKTLGMTMIRGLSRQIKARLDITQDTGIMIALRFNLTEKKARPVLSSVNGAD